MNIFLTWTTLLILVSDQELISFSLKALNQKTALEKPLTTKGSQPKRSDQKLLINQAISQMQQVKRRIHNHQTGVQTRELQQKIITDLESLIELTKKHQSQNSNKTPHNSTTEPKENQNSSPKQTGTKNSQSVNSNTSTSTENYSKTKLEPAPNEMKSQGDSLQSQPNLLVPLNREVWGHLPADLQERLKKMGPNDQYLPKYEQLIRDYYRSLAE